MISVSTETARLRASRSSVQSLKISFVSVVMSSVPAFAQDASTTSPPTSLPPIVVTAPPAVQAVPARPIASLQSDTGSTTANGNGQSPVISPTTVSTPVDQVASSITVITSADLQQDQRRTVPDALQTVPGLNIVQTGGPGGQTSVFMRGTNSNHVKVLVDGIDVSDPSTPNGAFDFAHLLTGDVERIEVLRGPQSGLYGSDALGGVISIVTKKGDGPPLAYASVEAGSFGTFNQATGVSGSIPGFNYAFNIAHFHADAVPVTPLYLIPPGESRLDNSYDNMTYSTKLGFEVSKDLTLNFVARYVDATYHSNGLFNFCATCSLPFVQEPEQSTQINRQFWTRGEAVWSLFDGRFKNYFGLAYTDAWTHIVDPWPGDASNSTSEGQRIKYDWRGVAELAPGQFLLTGVERQNESMDTFPGTYHTGDTAVWTQLQSEWGKRFFFVSNIRYDDNDSFGGHTTLRVAPAVILPDIDTKLKASYGTGFKAPSLSDLYVSFPPFFFANPDLKPEESKGYDVGFEQPLFNDRVRLGATYFHNDITNLIGYNSTFTSLINVGRATTYGAESFVSFAITTDLKLRADYTHLIARDDITGGELLRRPKNKVSVASSWKVADDLTLSATFLHVGSWEEQAIANNSVPMFAAPGYTTVNLAANYAATDKITLFGRIDNLFNEHYEDPAGFLRPGIGVFGGMRIKVDVANLAGELK